MEIGETFLFLPNGGQSSHSYPLTQAEMEAKALFLSVHSNPQTMTIAPFSELHTLED